MARNPWLGITISTAAVGDFERDFLSSVSFYLTKLERNTRNRKSVNKFAKGVRNSRNRGGSGKCDGSDGTE